MAAHTATKKFCFLVNYVFLCFLSHRFLKWGKYERHFLDEERKEIFAIKWLTAKVTILLDKRTSSLEISVYNSNVTYSFIYLTMLIKSYVPDTAKCKWILLDAFEFIHDADLIKFSILSIKTVKQCYWVRLYKPYTIALKVNKTTPLKLFLTPTAFTILYHILESTGK